MVERPSAIERFEAKYYVDLVTGCWVWTAYRNEWGYGQFGFKGKCVRAHRWSYEFHVGPIPHGLTIDHLCRNPGCVNPKHMEPVTIQENILRGEAPAAKQARRDECIHGHPFNMRNTYIAPSGKRECRICRRRIDKERYLRKGWRARRGNRHSNTISGVV